MTCIYVYKETYTQVKITSYATYRNNVSRKDNSMEILFRILLYCQMSMGFTPIA